MTKFITLLLSFFLVHAYSQEDVKIYKTRTGKLGINIMYQDSMLTIGSNELIVILDDERSDIVMRLSPETLKTGVDSLDKKLRDGLWTDVMFKGHLKTDYFNIEEKGKQQVEINGDLTLNGITKHILVESTIEHWEQGPGIQSMLYFHYDIELSDFELNEKLPGFDNHACIEILQALLKP